jgi:transposase
MLGKKKFEPKLVYNLTIDDLVPQDNFYRQLDKFLDLRFVYHECKSLYGKTGNPSLDPIVFFKLELVGYFENIISDRALVKTASDMLSVRYFLGYDIDEKLPWHSTISRTRGIIKQETFEKIFTEILGMCRDAGLIEGKHQSIDSTLVKANASLDSLELRKPKLDVKEFTKKVYEDNQSSGTNVQTGKKNGDDNYDGDESQPENNETIRLIDKSKSGKKPIPGKRNEKYISRTDPDSRIATKPKTPVEMYYSTFYSVDSKKKIITDVLTEHADKKDHENLIAVLDRAEKRLSDLGLSIEEVSADKGFSSGKNLRALEQRGIIPYIPAPKHTNNSGGFTSDKFKYDEEKRICICPNSKELRYSSYDYKKELMAFLPQKKDCQRCPLKQTCCPNADRRHLKRTIYYKEYERLKERLKTWGAKKASILRRTGPEPLFAEAKMYHGLSKYMSRGLENNQKRSYMIASVQNLKRLLKQSKKIINYRAIGQELLILSQYPLGLRHVQVY